MNKYFVPELSDFYPGYEYEIYTPMMMAIGEKYTPSSFNETTSTFIFNAFKEKVQDAWIRVPYLTRKQIEIEGWIYNEDLKAYGKEVKGSWLLLKAGHVIRDEDIIQSPLSICRLFNKDPFYLYVGQCKDINTFRKIIKNIGL